MRGTAMFGDGRPDLGLGIPDLGRQDGVAVVALAVGRAADGHHPAVGQHHGAELLAPELQRADLAPRRVGGVQVDDVGVAGVRADGEDQDLAVVVHHHAATARRRRCLADGRPGLGVDVHVGGLAGPVLDHEDLAVGGEDGPRVQAQRLGLGQPGQLGPGVVGGVVDLGEGGHDGLLELAAHDDLAAVGQGDHGGVPAGRVHRRRGRPLVGRPVVDAGHVEAGAGQLRAAGALLERGAADDDELPAGQAGLEGAEQGGRQGGVGGVGERTGVRIPALGAGQAVLAVPHEHVTGRADRQVDGDEALQLAVGDLDVRPVHHPRPAAWPARVPRRPDPRPRSRRGRPARPRERRVRRRTCAAM